MVWVDREYAGPLAVVSAWIAAILPWNVTYSGLSGRSWVLFVRFPFAELQYTAGVASDLDGLSFRSVLGAIELQSGQGLETATLLWGAAAAVLLAALAFSVVYYVEEATVEAGPVDPVRLIGGLLGVATVLLAAATAFIWTDGFGGAPIPIGVVLLGLLAAILLRAELTAKASK